MPSAIVVGMSSRVSWIVGALVLGAIALVVLMRPAPPADSPASPPPRELAAVPDEPRRGVDAGEEIAAPEPPPLPAQAAAPSEVVEQYREPARSIPTPPDFAANFAAEPIDPEWAPRAQTDILSRLAEQPGLQLLALQAECRTTMCQVQMTQPGSSANEPPMTLLKTLGMQPLSVNALRGPPNILISVAYVARPGHEPAPMRQRAADPPEQR
jgi:hypothetical protein